MEFIHENSAYSSIYFIVFSVVLCYVHIDGKIHLETVFQAMAWYSILRTALLLDGTDGIVFLSQAIVSCTRIQVPICVRSNIP